MGLPVDLAVKYAELCTILREMSSLLVAFSGGVDSALLARVAHDVLGERAVLVTAQSESLPAREALQAEAFAAHYGIRHVLIGTAEVSDPSYAANPVNRCYFCKRELFGALQGLQMTLGADWIAYGENHDDGMADRPGAKAAEENRVRAPLKEAGLTKAEIRVLARHLGLSVWNKPASACLASRFPYGTAITPERLAQVEAAEDCLWELGFGQYRVRFHGEIARIEVDPGDRNRLLEVADQISERFRAVGFTYVTMDLQGYRSGSMNEGPGGQRA